MGQNQTINQTKDDISCYKCKCHYLLELISIENSISLRKYCFCCESTEPITKNTKSQLMSNYQNYKCNCRLIQKDKKNISKYCYECEQFLCKDCLKNHEHKNVIEPQFFLTNCKNHPNEKLVGHCIDCIKPICNKCINDIHNSHEIKYTKDLEISDEIIAKYNNNLLKAFLDCDKLMKLKYGKDIKVNIVNLSNSQSLTFFDNNDKQIIVSLEILKTIIDLYKYHKNNNTLNYQLICNVLKHVNMEIMRLPDKENKENIPVQNELLNRFASITNTVIDNTDKPNKNINIYLKIDLINKEKRIKRINILKYKLINKSIGLKGKKLIKLLNGDLAFCYEYNKKIIFFKDLKEIDVNLEVEDYIKDFIQLENQNLAILLKNKLVIYKYDNHIYILEKEIDLDKNKNHYIIRNIANNSFAMLSAYYKNYNIEKTFLTILKYPDYKLEEIELLNYSNHQGELIQMNNLIIMCFELNEKNIEIYFYDLKNKNLESKNIKNGERYYNKEFVRTFYDKKINCFKIDKNRILISTIKNGLIFNIKTKQIESYIHNFKQIYSLCKVADYMLAGTQDGKIYQIDIKKGKIYNEYILKYVNLSNNKYLASIIDIGNSQFCSLSCIDGVYLFKYN